jgi:predicted Rdx family selenoprotein
MVSCSSLPQEILQCLPARIYINKSSSVYPILTISPQFAQELLSTFSTSLGEVGLRPGMGGVFVVEIFYQASSEQPPTTANEVDDPAKTSASPTIQRRVLWDRKVDGGFPETKELKRRVRDVMWYSPLTCREESGQQVLTYPTE